MREYDKKVVVYESEIRYASKVREQKLITCLSNTLSFIITMAQNFVRQSSQKNFELDYTFWLEVSIKGNVLTFTDDKGNARDMK